MRICVKIHHAPILFVIWIKYWNRGDWLQISWDHTIFSRLTSWMYENKCAGLLWFTMYFYMWINLDNAKPSSFFYKSVFAGVFWWNQWIPEVLLDKAALIPEPPKAPTAVNTWKTYERCFAETGEVGTRQWFSDRGHLANKSCCYCLV